jgi:hypothetical protein
MTSHRAWSARPGVAVLSWPATWWQQIVYKGALVGLWVFAWRVEKKRSGRAGRKLLAVRDGNPADLLAERL